MGQCLLFWVLRVQDIKPYANLFTVKCLGFGAECVMSICLSVGTCMCTHGRTHLHAYKQMQGNIHKSIY